MNPIQAEGNGDNKSQSAFLKDKVLIVEDDEHLRNNIAEMLQLSDYHVYEASNGVEGLRTALSKKPALILTDLLMPEMDGVELLKNLRGNAVTTHIPVIFLTARVGIDDRLNALEIGADDYVTKPFNAQELLLKIRNAISSRKKLFARLNADEGGVQYESREDRFINSVKQIIEANLSNEKLGLNELSDHLHLSPSAVQKKIKRITGKSVNQLLREYRLGKAKQMLDNNAYSVSEIAYLVGFGSVSYFSKRFKDFYGFNPSKKEE
jgi:YesN/AraC family two-component response regulator